jgi:hypothetical protein
MRSAANHPILNPPFEKGGQGGLEITAKRQTAKSPSIPFFQRGKCFAQNVQHTADYVFSRPIPSLAKRIHAGTFVLIWPF